MRVVLILIQILLPLVLLECIEEEKFRNNGNGTITDNKTGLLWEVKTDENETAKYMWDEAITYCDNLTLGGYADWELPIYDQLITIVDISRNNPSINTQYFPNCQAFIYWSSTTAEFISSSALGVYFDHARQVPWNKENYGHARCVRGTHYYR